MSRKIVIVEDDQAIALMYKMKLESADYKVATAGNGIIGLKVIEAEKPELILLDIMMPEMNGDEMLEKLRQKDYGQTIKVIVLTNNNDEKMTAKLKALNTDEILIKATLTPQQVLEAVQNILK